MTSNNAFERTVERRGPRLAAARAVWPAAQLGRWVDVQREGKLVDLRPRWHKAHPRLRSPQVMSAEGHVGLRLAGAGLAAASRLRQGTRCSARVNGVDAPPFYGCLGAGDGRPLRAAAVACGYSLPNTAFERTVKHRATCRRSCGWLAVDRSWSAAQLGR